MSQSIHTTELLLGVDDRPPLFRTIILGLQHVLAMDVYVVPFIIAISLGMDSYDSLGLIQSTFLAAGLASLVQVLFFLRMPVCQGASFVPVGAIIGIYYTSGNFGTVLGATFISAIMIIILGYTKLYQRFIQHFFPNIVVGTIIFIVGLTLLPVAFLNNIYIGETVHENIININLALITAAMLVTFSMVGVYFPKYGRIFRISAVILALVIGSMIANYLGLLNLEQVKTTRFISPPHFTFINFQLNFEISAIITMLIIHLVLLAETTGTWYAVSSAAEVELDGKQINQGVIGEGYGCLIASLVGSTPVTGYSTNAGIISITGIASRTVFIAASLWFILFAFLGKLSAIINSIPAPVIGGAFVIVCAMILLGGIKVITVQALHEREFYIVGIPIITVIALVLLPAEIKEVTPQLLRYLLDSPIAFGSLVVLALNICLPQKRILRK